MPVTNEKMLNWCRTMLHANPAAPKRSTRRLSGGDPATFGAGRRAGRHAGAGPRRRRCQAGRKIGDGDIRLRSMVDTLQFGLERGWKQIIFGHIGRKPEGSLKEVAQRLGEMLGRDVPLIADWLDEGAKTIPAKVSEQIAAAQPGSVLMLENTRRYAIERVLWKAKPDDLPQARAPTGEVRQSSAPKIAKVYVNEALSAGSLDARPPSCRRRWSASRWASTSPASSTARCAAASKAQLVVFSGLKIDKLDDLEAMIDRGTIRWVFAAGSLAMALRRPSRELDGKEFSLGRGRRPGPRRQAVLHSAASASSRPSG